MRPKGLGHSEETKRKISKSLKGRKLSTETKLRMSAAQKGHSFRGKSNYKMSVESRNNIRLGIKNTRYTEEYAQKLSETKRGSLNPKVRLTETEVKKIRNMYANGGISQQKLADLFGVHRSTIADIVNNRTWQHVK